MKTFFLILSVFFLHFDQAQAVQTQDACNAIISGNFKLVSKLAASTDFNFKCNVAQWGEISALQTSLWSENAKKGDFLILDVILQTKVLYIDEDITNILRARPNDFTHLLNIFKLSKGYDPNHFTESDFPLLMYAIDHQADHENIKTLIDDKTINVNARLYSLQHNRFGLTAIILAINRSDAEVVSMLTQRLDLDIDFMPDMPPPHHYAEFEGMTALTFAVSEYIANFVIDPNPAQRRETLLIIIKSILDAKADPALARKEGFSAKSLREKDCPVYWLGFPTQEKCKPLKKLLDLYGN